MVGEFGFNWWLVLNVFVSVFYVGLSSSDLYMVWVCKFLDGGDWR